MGSGAAARCAGIGEAGRECAGFLFQNPNQLFDRADLAERFWSSNSFVDAKAAISSMTSRVRAALRQMKNPDIHIKSDKWSLGVFYEDSKFVDTANLERIYSQVQKGIFDLGSLECCLGSLYRGKFLPGLQGHWAVIERERLQSMFVRTALMAIDHFIDQRNYQTALDTCRYVLSHDPLRETVHRRVMILMAISGENARMRQHYANLEAFVITACDAQPDKRTRELFDDLCTQPSRPYLDQLVERELD